MVTLAVLGLSTHSCVYSAYSKNLSLQERERRKAFKSNCLVFQSFPRPCNGYEDTDLSPASFSVNHLQETVWRRV